MLIRKAWVYIFLIANQLLWSCVVLAYDANNGYLLGKWPLLVSYEESECMLIDDDRTAILPSVWADGQSIYSKMILFNTGGKIFVNPEINENRDTLTFHIETANKKGVVVGYNCFVRVDLHVKAARDKYKKFYVVTDKTVFYELEIKYKKARK